MKHSSSALRKEDLEEASAAGSPAVKNLVLSLEAWGRLRRELIWTLGDVRARGAMTRFGVSCGQSEAIRKSTTDKFLEQLGQVHMTPDDSHPGQVICNVGQSKEALEHLRFFGPAVDIPQCWLLAGYLSGRESHFGGELVYFVETHCIAKGDSACRFVGKTHQEWTKDDSADLRHFQEDNMAIELENTLEQLQSTKDRYQNLFEQSSSAIFIIDPTTGLHLNANQSVAELTGYSKTELLKMNIFDLCDSKDHHQLMEDMKSLAAGLRVTDHEISLVRKDGTIRIMASASKVISYGGQNVIQAVMRDVTDLKISAQKEKDLQNQLLRSERLSSIGRLAAGVAHELKNPLGAIRNAIYYIRNAIKDSPLMETDPNLKMIMKLAEGEVDASVLIIGELLDFSRVVQLMPRRTVINELLEKLPSMVTIPDNIAVEMDLNVALPSASVDPDRLNQVFANIVNNACQAMAQGGKLKFKSNFIVETNGKDDVAQEFIVVSIEDTGSGIDPLHLSKIFEPLFTTKARGTGLGLAISRNIVEKHGGVILVTSQVGKGTNFIIKLPLQPPADKEAAS